MSATYNISKTLARLRAQHGWKQSEIAAKVRELTGVQLPPARVSRLENGYSWATMEEIIPLAKCLGAEPSDFIPEPARPAPAPAASPAVKPVAPTTTAAAITPASPTAPSQPAPSAQVAAIAAPPVPAARPAPYAPALQPIRSTPATPPSAATTAPQAPAAPDLSLPPRGTSSASAYHAKLVEELRRTETALHTPKLPAEHWRRWREYEKQIRLTLMGLK